MRKYVYLYVCLLVEKLGQHLVAQFYKFKYLNHVGLAFIL